jgi:hypothetical protein
MAICIAGVRYKLRCCLISAQTFFEHCYRSNFFVVDSFSKKNDKFSIESSSMEHQTSAPYLTTAYLLLPGMGSLKIINSLNVPKFTNNVYS